MPDAEQKEVAVNVKRGKARMKMLSVLPVKSSPSVPTQPPVKEKLKRKKRLPKSTLRVSLMTLIEVEKWAEKARVGETRYAFEPVLFQIKYNNDDLYDTIHALTLAQIMPYQEIWRHWKLHTMAVSPDDFEFVENLSVKYKTSKRNVVERLHHVRELNRYYEDINGIKEKTNT